MQEEICTICGTAVSLPRPGHRREPATDTASSIVVPTARCPGCGEIVKGPAARNALFGPPGF